MASRLTSLSRAVMLRADAETNQILCVIGLGIAASAVVVGIVLNVALPYSTVLVALAQGPAVAAYAPFILAGRPRAAAIGGGMLFGLLGLSHAFWLMHGLRLIDTLGFTGTTSVNEFSVMLLATGLVFTVALLASGVVRAALVTMPLSMLVALTISELGASGVGSIRTENIALASAPLHIGIAGSLFWRSRREWIEVSRRLSHVCACGYDLRGNASGICPECGASVV